MIIDAKLKAKYDYHYPHFEYIQNYLDQTLLKYTRKNLFAYISRIKEIDSIYEKIETGRYKDWYEIDDFIGCVIIIPNLSYEKKVLTFLSNTFQKEFIREKGKTFKSYEVFRFDSTRFIGTLKPENRTKETEIHKIKFEIQIRSAFEHAWVINTHDLAYKSETIDWKILRLVSQIKSSVEQLDMITLGAKENSKNITEFKWPDIDIKIEILNFIKDKFEKGLIPIEIKPKDFSRIIDNFYSILIEKLKNDKWKQRKWKAELKKIFNVIDEELEEFNKTGFPKSLSLFQLLFGISAKKGIITKQEAEKYTFYKSDLFLTFFPELKGYKFNVFNL